MKRPLIEERPLWRWWVTPRPLKNKPIHRWYIFPHSFTSELVQALINEWGLDSKDCIVDCFAGAGTTLLAAKEKGIPANGYDLSPLSVLATQAKIANHNIQRLKNAWEELRSRINPVSWGGLSKGYPKLIERALPGMLLVGFDNISRQIGQLSCSAMERIFFHLALISIIPHYSRALPTGGWLKWVDTRTRANSILSVLTNRIETMLKDIQELKLPRRSGWTMNLADARQLPDPPSYYSAAITSPPYPNRHDYTRVFGVELMFGFLNWEDTRQLRYQSFHSHPEARPERGSAPKYIMPKRLSRALARIEREDNDPRIRPMLEGYFLDMYLCLKELKRVCRRKAKIALVLGNAQYCGEPIIVDEITAELGEQVGLCCEKIIAVRYRGNSAQQMRVYGCTPARESIVVFSKP